MRGVVNFCQTLRGCGVQEGGSSLAPDRRVEVVGRSESSMNMLLRPLGSCLWLFVGLVLVTILVAVDCQPSVSTTSGNPAGLESSNDTPVGGFSATRAMDLVRRLCDEIGERPNGTPAHARAAEILVEELRKIPGVEVELQHPGGVHRYKAPPWPFPPFVYRTTNVVARLPGRAPTALLLDAHFDTVPGTPGAGDDALGVAVMVEALRVLASKPQLQHSVVVNLNGAEEIGMLGAAGFLQHPLAKDVRAYVYIDGGPQGNALVVGSGPQNGWLLEEYAKATGATHATVIGEDLISSGLLAHSGDFLPFHEAGLVGIDLGAVSDFWSVHTDRDNTSRIDRATIQAMGDKILAVAKRLANGPLSGNVDHTPRIYYDILGRFVLNYSKTTARIVALVVLAFSVLALVLATRRGAFTVRLLAAACARLLLVDAAALLAPALLALFLTFVVRRPHGWFSQPALAIWAFGAASIGAALAVLYWWRRRCRAIEPRLVTLASGLCFWSILLGLATYANVGCGYVPLWWTGFTALGLIGTLLVPAWRGVWWIISFLPGSVLLLSFFTLVFPFLVADIGFVAAPMPLDVVVAGFIALSVALLLPSALAILDPELRLGGAATSFCLVALVGSIVTASINPYSVERPKRVAASLVERGSNQELFLASRDALPLAPVLGGVPEATALPSKWSPLGPMNPPFTHSMPTTISSGISASIDVLSSSFDSSRNLRKVMVRLEADCPQLRFFVPRTALHAWSLGDLARDARDTSRNAAVMFEDAGPKDRELTLELNGSELVEVELIAVRGASDVPAMKALASRLPSWTALSASEMRILKKAI